MLDATKLIPEELVPVTPVGRMVLNRNLDNFFAETEQVAFCTAHVVPGDGGICTRKVAILVARCLRREHSLH